MQRWGGAQAGGRSLSEMVAGGGKENGRASLLANDEVPAQHTAPQHPGAQLCMQALPWAHDVKRCGDAARWGKSDVHVGLAGHSISLDSREGEGRVGAASPRDAAALVGVERWSLCSRGAHVRLPAAFFALLNFSKIPRSSGDHQLHPPLPCHPAPPLPPHTRILPHDCVARRGTRREGERGACFSSSSSSLLFIHFSHFLMALGIELSDMARGESERGGRDLF